MQCMAIEGIEITSGRKPATLESVRDFNRGANIIAAFLKTSLAQRGSADVADLDVSTPNEFVSPQELGKKISPPIVIREITAACEKVGREYHAGLFSGYLVNNPAVQELVARLTRAVRVPSGYGNKDVNRAAPR